MQDQEEGMSKYQIWKQFMQVINTLSYLIIITYSRFKKEGPVICLQDDGFNLGRLILYIKNKETKKMKYAES